MSREERKLKEIEEGAARLAEMLVQARIEDFDSARIAEALGGGVSAVLGGKDAFKTLAGIGRGGDVDGMRYGQVLVLDEHKAVAIDVLAELHAACNAWPKFNSAHEGYAVLLEELDELWQHVKVNQKRREIALMKKEAVQVAAMAMRFAIEICNEEDGRK